MEYKDYPYVFNQKQKGTCKYREPTRNKGLIKNFYTINSRNDPKQLLAALQHGPVIIAVHADRLF
jgi:hypothetical protein